MLAGINAISEESRSQTIRNGQPSAEPRVPGTGRKPLGSFPALLTVLDEPLAPGCVTSKFDESAPAAGVTAANTSRGSASGALPVISKLASDSASSKMSFGSAPSSGDGGGGGGGGGFGAGGAGRSSTRATGIGGVGEPQPLIAIVHTTLAAMSWRAIRPYWLFVSRMAGILVLASTKGKRVAGDIPFFTDRDVMAARGPKAIVDPWRPVAALVESERQADGCVQDVATIFLANRECSFRCVFCDLWQHTLDEPTPTGAVLRQIDIALESLPSANVLKLYNSGNFFDSAAIPPSDWPGIAERVRRFERVIVENHPKLVDDRTLRFRDLIRPNTRLEVALGLETTHPDVLPRLNKRMTVDDFSHATRFLVDHDIDVRAFVLLRPPFMTSDDEAIDWTLRSMQFAFDCGANCCSVIPVRANNGLMERLQTDGDFSPPQLSSLEIVLAEGIALNRGRVFVDLWDAERFAEPGASAADRIERMRQMNLSQTVLPTTECAVGEIAADR